MFRNTDGRIIASPSDLAVASSCEFAFSRKLDAVLGRIEAVDRPDDPMAAKAAMLGDQHEHAVLRRYQEQFDRVVEIDRPRARDDRSRDAAATATQRAFEEGADVVFQATFFDGSMIGFADFVVRQDDGRYQIVDTKLARSPKVTALMQLAAYAEQLELIGVPVSPDVVLILGDNSVSVHALRDITPVFRARKARLYDLIDMRLAASDAIEWASPLVTACGKCEWCAPEVIATDDLIQVAGLRHSQRTTLRAAGVTTMTELANRHKPVEGMFAATLEDLRNQARLQLHADTSAGDLPYEIRDAQAVAGLPLPDDGDLFFDFEGDPLHSEPGTVEDETKWGLDYLFGMVDMSRKFTAFWAHDLAQERQALIDFLAFVRQRREQYPGLHIYHYAPYEKTHLLSIAARHGVGEAEVDGLLRDGVLVDLYPIVRRMLQIGADSYSLKKVEALYLPRSERSGEVETAAGSVEAYWIYRDLIAQDDPTAADVLASIARYNEVDCVSTRLLHRWLINTAAQRGIYPAGRSEATESDAQADLEAPESEIAVKLWELAGDPAQQPRSADNQALALASAAVEYHRRERKSYWWAHFARLEHPVSEWASTRDVFVVDQARMVGDWVEPTGSQRTARREIELIGTFGPGTTLRIGDSPFVMYDFGGPRVHPNQVDEQRPTHARTTITAIDVGAGRIRIEERGSGDLPRYDDIPLAITPPRPIPPGKMPEAIAQWAGDLLADQPTWRKDPVTDVLRRLPSRFRNGQFATVGETGYSDATGAVVDSLRRLDNSYLAVQGPPGTGKTYTGARVIAELVMKYRWRIGVVAQSHAAVENLLRGVIEAGVPGRLVGKRAGGTASTKRDKEAPWTTLTAAGITNFMIENSALVLGGTAWDFANATRVRRKSLDLLVVDEAGQYSLATTIAAGVSSKNLLLLGDPQQLPQVSQGTHPAPTDMSALGHLSDGFDVLPPEFGYFLAQTRRMSPPLTEVVSDLSYQRQLTATGDALKRELRLSSTQGDRADIDQGDRADIDQGDRADIDRSAAKDALHLAAARPLGIAGTEAPATSSETAAIPTTAGLHPVEVHHTGRATESPEEAIAVVSLIKKLLGHHWHDPAEGDEGRPLVPTDFIVVTPYNAQVSQITAALDAAQLSEVPVGTVDKFQGREAVISIISMTASSPADVPRGMSFVLQRNRLNVAISRAQWASYLVYSPWLTDYLPSSPAGVAELSAFLRLVDPGHS